MSRAEDRVEGYVHAIAQYRQALRNIANKTTPCMTCGEIHKRWPEDRVSNLASTWNSKVDGHWYQRMEISAYAEQVLKGEA